MLVAGDVKIVVKLNTNTHAYLLDCFFVFLGIHPSHASQNELEAVREATI
jgi:hypothetical protein